VSGEYLGRSSTVDREGWFPTRDGGFLDVDGYLFLDGRIDDVIVRGGENMSPGEIEDVLLEHEAVADCAVVGIPDEQWGEAVAAAVVLKPGAKATVGDIQEWVRHRLRSSRTPQRIEFRDELPYNETGKPSQAREGGAQEKYQARIPSPWFVRGGLDSPGRRTRSSTLRSLVRAPSSWTRLGRDGDPDTGRLRHRTRDTRPARVPHVALCRGRPSAAATELFDRFDVVATSEAEAAPVLATASRVPIAATALAQLLRLGERLGLHDGLVAESLVYSTLQAGPEFAAWRQANPPRLRASATMSPRSPSSAATIALPRTQPPGAHNAFWRRCATRSPRRCTSRCRTRRSSRSC
jgi:hypothetical protein